MSSRPGYISELKAPQVALPDIAEHGIKVVVNTGVADTKLAHKLVTQMVSDKGLNLNIAWIGGTRLLMPLPSYGAPSLLALRTYAPAKSLMTGNLSLCTRRVTWVLLTYVTGGCFRGFKSLKGKWQSLASPLAEISAAGEVVITKQKNTQGILTVDTCTAQLLYEIQAPYYYNSDVTAVIDQAVFTQIGPDRVAPAGIKAYLPPPTTKLGITAHGEYSVEVHYALVGLEIEEKAAMIEEQIRKCMGDRVNDYSVLHFQTVGRAPDDPNDQDTATVDFRILAQARKAEAVNAENFLGKEEDSCKRPSG
ncbi:uncharacterized protein A1O9_09333 [Exophiala aquamarina CBS 119918]|uniref:Acyclic terpene utilisation N-terminal domain-containing protein n=1 Tax=Exophiala aquamarina CBS 119918 TaxID=1182545 RepID=A0A072PH93_9EURO|nr:uncharacterized protein A1O9_09333 [Exophiala aquamarina CBS 119918]KEF54890.1 hypothetical protein A1O9_09333 [Exophiala aquamarina CBS 119918]